MYGNLSRCLKLKGLSVLAASKAVDMAEATFRTKLNDRAFSVDEAFAVRDTLFPEYDIRFLFRRDNDDVEQDAV